MLAFFFFFKKKKKSYGLKKIGHSVITFDKNYWVKPYIMLNMKLKMAKKNELEKKNNTFLGKTIENIRNHNKTKVVTSQEKYIK